MRTPEPLGQQARWLDLLSEYNFKIQHRSGIAHRNGDAISRRPCERESEVECQQSRPKPRAGCFIIQGGKDVVLWISTIKPSGSLSGHSVSSYPAIDNATVYDPDAQNLAAALNVSRSSDVGESRRRIRLAQEADSDIAPVIKWKQSESAKPKWNDLASYSETTKNYCAQWDTGSRTWHPVP